MRFSSIINGGYYYKPHVVKSILNTDGGIVEDYDKMLVDLLNDKIRQWERKCDEQRKEINRLKKQLREIKKNESEGE